MRPLRGPLVVLLLSLAMLTVPAVATAAASAGGGSGSELSCTGGGEVTEIAPGLGTCDQDGDGQPDQVVGHIPLPGIGAVDVNAGQFVHSTPFFQGTGTFFIVTAETTEDSPVGENRVGVSGICFTTNKECAWVNVAAIASSGESSVLGEREAIAIVDCGGIFGQACVPGTPAPTVSYEDEERSLSFEQTPFGPWYNLDYEEDGVGEAHFTGGTFVFLVRITGGTLEVETYEESPVGHNEVSVFSMCVGFAANPCLASLSAISVSTGEGSPAGENDVLLDSITCQTVENPITGVGVSCRGGVLTQTNTDVDIEHVGTQSVTIEAFPEGPVTVCTSGDHVDEGCQTFPLPGA